MKPMIGESYLDYMARTDPSHISEVVRADRRKAERRQRVAARLEREEAARQARKLAHKTSGRKAAC